MKLLFDQRPASSTSPMYDLSEFFAHVRPTSKMGNWTWGKSGERGEKGTYLVEKTFHSFAVMNPLLF